MVRSKNSSVKKIKRKGAGSQSVHNESLDDKLQIGVYFT